MYPVQVSLVVLCRCLIFFLSLCALRRPGRSLVAEFPWPCVHGQIHRFKLFTYIQRGQSGNCCCPRGTVQQLILRVTSAPPNFLVSDTCYVDNVPSEIHSVLSTPVTNLYCNLVLDFPHRQGRVRELEQCFTCSVPQRDQIQMQMCQESCGIWH